MTFVLRTNGIVFHSYCEWDSVCVIVKNQDGQKSFLFVMLKVKYELKQGCTLAWENT